MINDIIINDAAFNRERRYTERVATTVGDVMTIWQGLQLILRIGLKAIRPKTKMNFI